MPDMFAAVAERMGGPEVIRYRSDLPKPNPKKSELRIRVTAAGINPIDCARRAGYGRALFKLLGASRFPLVLGSDFAGVIDSVGDEVTAWESGEAVFGCKAVSLWGTHAQFVTVPASQVLRMPKSLTPEQAAAVPYSFITAYRLLQSAFGTEAEKMRHRKVLVHGGLGSVGSLAVGMLRNMGANVEISHRAPMPTGAAVEDGIEVIDVFQAGARSVRARYDAILNCAAFQGEERLFPLIKGGGCYVTIVHPLLATLDEFGWLRGALRARHIWRTQARQFRAFGGSGYRWVIFKPDARAHRNLERMANQGLLKPDIACVMPIQDAADAHARMASARGRGKIVLKLS